MSTFFIGWLKKGHFYFELKTANGRTLLRGNYYETREECEAQVNRIVKYCQKRRLFNRCKSDNGTFYFCLNDKKGIMMASSEEYATMAGVKKAIRAVRKHSVRAQIERE